MSRSLNQYSQDVGYTMQVFTSALLSFLDALRITRTGCVLKERQHTLVTLRESECDLYYACQKLMDF